MQPFQHAAALDDIGFDPCHVVQFYQGHRFLSNAVVDFLAAGLTAGQAGVLITTPAHGDALVAGLSRRDIDVDHDLATGRLTLRDARDMLDAIMHGPLPDANAFHRIMGRLLTEASCAAAIPARVRTSRWSNCCGRMAAPTPRSASKRCGTH